MAHDGGEAEKWVMRRISQEFRRCSGGFYGLKPDDVCHYCNTLQGSEWHAGLIHNPCCKCGACPEPPKLRPA